MEETQTGRWQVSFFDVPIGWIDPDKKKLRRLAAPGDRRHPKRDGGVAGELAGGPAAPGPWIQANIY